MKTIKYFILSIAFLGLVSCEKSFEDFQLNPNLPNSAPPSLLIQGVLNDMFENCWNEVMRWNQFYCCNYNYYGNQEYNWTTNSFEFSTLINVQRMEDQAVLLNGSEENPYSALGKFFRAYFSTQMSLKFGDIPMSQSLKGLENSAPAYDSQKQVFIQSLDLLDEANDLMEAAISKGNNSLQGDIYLDNDLGKWRKVINSYKLRILIHLSKHADEADINVKGRFAEVLNNPSKFPLLSGLEDNMAYQYNSSVNLYPNNPGTRGFDSGRYNMSATYLNTLVLLQDPRTFVVADPAAKKLAEGLTEADYAAYIGASSGEGLDDMTFKAGNGEYSYIDQERYYSTFQGPEPCIQIGYAELCFNIAEAINRGWVNGNAADWYQKGITASMNFYGISDAATLNMYLSQPSVVYKGNTAEGLAQILTQKYLAFFQNSGWEAYYNWRRTGVPTFLTGIGTGNGGRIPKRFQYPASERTTNKTNYDAAIQSQYSGQDDINAEMWLIK